MATDKFEKIKKIAERMERNDINRDSDFLAYEDMKHCRWVSPPELANVEWWRKVINTDVADAIRTAVNILTATEPHVTIQPMAENQETKDLANQWEKALEWQLMNANRRRPVSIQKDVVDAAATYAATAVQVIDLRHMLEANKTINASSARYEAALRYGDYMITCFNPRDVHVERSSMMVERVLLCQSRRAQEVMDEWGDLGARLESLADSGSEVTYYDYWDNTTRCVWVKEMGDPLLPPTPHELGFIPWAAVMGGSDIEQEGRHKYKPIGYATHQSNDWVTSNIVKSLIASEVIKNAFSKRIVVEGPNAEDVDLSSGSPDQAARIPSGHSVKELNSPQIDRAMSEVDDRLAGKISSSTLPSVLSGASSTADAFATLNLKTQTGLIQLDPTKKLAEQTLAEVFMIILQWAAFTGRDLVGYGMNKKEDLGKEYTIPNDAIDPQYIYLTVKLDDSDPTDKQQVANTAIQLVTSGIYSKERALEEMGETNPQAMMEQVWMERMLDNKFQIEMQLMQAQAQMMQQQVMQQMQQMQQQAQAQAMAEQQAMQSPVPGGPMFNPGAGGQPPAMANPGITREMMNGEAANGVPIA